MSRAKVGNLYYNPRMVAPLEWPPRAWERCIRDVEEHLGRRRQPREVEFMTWLYFALQRGTIPGPTELNRCMGLKKGGEQNVLSGTFSTIRRIVFEHAGLVSPTAAHPRYEWPREFESAFR